MRFAYSQATQDLDTLMGRFRDVGYEGLQLKHNQYFPWVEEPRRFLDERGGLPGVASGLIAYGPYDEAGRENLRKIGEFAAAVGAELVVYCHGQSREGMTPEVLRGYAKDLSELGKRYRDQGVKLSLHNHAGQPVMVREDFAVFFDAVEDDAVGLTLDTAHAVKSGVEDVAGVIREMKPFLDNFHMKDFADGEFRVLGEGTIDFEPIYQAVRDIGYDGWVCTDEESGSDVMRAMEKCFAHMRRGLGA